MDFAEFIAPMSVDQFKDEYFGKRPVHIVSDESPRGDLLSSSRLEELLAVRDHWTEENLKLIINSRAVSPQHFLEDRLDGSPGRRADPAKVQVFLEMGASLVGDHIEDIDPKVRSVVAMLSEEFAATAGANLYCSFQGVRAFNSHCDPHDVFAVQLEGEKTWQIYENRAESPVAPLEGENAQALIDSVKGNVLMIVRMQPGDLLYMPRGFFHDALAQSTASLHLTFAVAPLDGRYVFRLLEQIAVRYPQYRAYLPDGRREPDALRESLADLAADLAGLVRSPLFENLLTGRQRALVTSADQPSLGRPRKLEYYARTDQPFEFTWDAAGAVLRHRHGQEVVGVIVEPLEWVLEQAAFSKEQLQARFQWLSADEVGAVIELVRRAGLFVPYDPPL